MINSMDYQKKKRKITSFDIVNSFVMVIMMLIMVYPFWYTIVGSLNEGADYIRGGVYFWPRKFTTYNYRAVFHDPQILQAFYVTILKCLIGTITSLLATTLVAYGISRPDLKLKNIYIPFIMFTMFFSGGMVPYFLLIKNLGLYDNFWVYIIPTLFSVYNMIIIQSFVQELPASLIESAKIDGANEYRIFFQIIVPLSKPVLATIALFTLVGHWNSYFDSMMYTNSRNLQTIQLFLKKIITDPATAKGIGASAAVIVPDHAVKLTPQSMKFATMVVTSVPIIVVYPFLQKYFVTGITLGAVKG